MKQTTIRWRALALALLAVLSPPRPGAAQTAAASGAPEFTLEEAYRLARTRNPMLRAAGAAADAAATREPAARTPPDPIVEIGIMNFSVPGFDADMATSMAPSIQVMQMLPWFGKRKLSGRIAEQSTAIARAAWEEAWWEVRNRTAMAFFTIYEADRQLDVMRETLGFLRDFEQVAKAMYSGGEGRQSDVLRAGVEGARMDADIKRMEAMRTSTAARLNGIFDRPAATPVPSPGLADLPLDVPGADTLRAWAEATRPLLDHGRLSVEQARTRGELTRKEIWPDPIFGVQYGQRSRDMGTERMGSAMIGFSVPIFARSRQLRMRDEAAAMEAMAQADLADMRAHVDARIGELLAELDRTRTLVELFRAEVLPQARANVESSFSSYRVGRVDFMTLVDAQMTVNQYEQELYSLLAEYGRSIAELETTIGRELPRSSHSLAETR
jgi:outer membrane protein TolC